VKNPVFINLINKALHKAMQLDKNTLCYGLGINDKARVYGSTAGLVETFGEDRVFDMPTAENGMTGIGVGLALKGFRPVLSHCRLDFSLLSMDQIINSAAKWHSLFAGTMSVPMTIRSIVGRGWGQGPTHCQSLQSCFANIPGLKVVMPSIADNAYGLLLSSIFDDNPVIFIEHRWLHNLKPSESCNPYEYYPLEKANVITSGSDITIVSMSYATVEALHAVNYLKQQGINCELVDLCTIKPIDWKTIENSVKKTGRLVVLDTGFEFCSVASEVISHITSNFFSELVAAPARVAMPDFPVLTSPALANSMYSYADDIAKKVCQILQREVDLNPLSNERSNYPKDTPGNWFTGPF
jgi:pyruvate/2-oxoglutarate/acetoin dehydrogenase E1 component